MVAIIEEPEITTISEKGQVVIPIELRKHLNIKPRTKFLVFGTEDTIIMKKLQLPDLKKEWKNILGIMDNKNLKITEEEVQNEVQKYRKEKV